MKTHCACVWSALFEALVSWSQVLLSCEIVSLVLILTSLGVQLLSSNQHRLYIISIIQKKICLDITVLNLDITILNLGVIILNLGISILDLGVSVVLSSVILLDFNVAMCLVIIITLALCVACEHNVKILYSLMC